MNHIYKKIGSLVPSSNATQEQEFWAALPKDTSLHTSRLKLTQVEADSTIRIVEELEDGSRRLADADVDVLLLALTAPSSRKGIGYDRELKKRMEDASGKPATTAATATVEALNVLGVRRVALCAPWSEEVNAFTASFLEASGFEVPTRKALGVVQNLEIGALSTQTAYDLGKSANSDKVDAVMLACGNWHSMAAVERLEQEIGKPVITTNQVSMWGALRILGHVKSLPGYGSLLRDHLAAA
jgi:maleate cis-trans isomerase